MKKFNQKGFGILEVLLVGVVIGLLGGAGWYIMNKNKQIKPQSTNGTVNHNAEDSKKGSSKVEQAEPEKGLYQFKELGITIKLPEDVSDLVYEMRSASQSSIPNWATLSTSSLIALDSACTAKHGALGGFAKLEGQYNEETAPGELVKQFSNFYIVNTPAMGCPNGFEAKVGEQFRKQSQALKSAYSTVKEL